MTERDEALQKLLRQWEPPAPDPRLDARVWKSFRRSAISRRARLARKWVPIAAGVLVLAASARLWLEGPAKPRSLRLEITADATGFTPVSNGAITVVKEEGRQ